MGNVIQMLSAGAENGSSDRSGSVYIIVGDGEMFRKMPVTEEDDAALVARMHRDMLGEESLRQWPDEEASPLDDTERHAVAHLDFAGASRMYTVGDRRFVFERPYSHYRIPESIPLDFVRLLESILFRNPPHQTTGVPDSPVHPNHHHTTAVVVPSHKRRRHRRTRKTRPPIPFSAESQLKRMGQGWDTRPAQEKAPIGVGQDCLPYEPPKRPDLELFQSIMRPRHTESPIGSFHRM